MSYLGQRPEIGKSLSSRRAGSQLKDQDEMANYVRWTGDEGGIIRDAAGNVVSGNCWNGSAIEREHAQVTDCDRNKGSFGKVSFPKGPFSSL